MCFFRLNFYHIQIMFFFWGVAFSPNAFAQAFTPPDAITFSDKIYKIAYKKEAPNGRAIYEYTTNNESIEKWTTLVTLNYARGISATPVQWLEILKGQLKSNGAFPNSNLYQKENHGFAYFVFPPVNSYPEFESNIHKSFHIANCDGMLVYQYAVKYPKETNLMLINYESEGLGKKIEEDGWVPDCR